MDLATKGWEVRRRIGLDTPWQEADNTFHELLEQAHWAGSFE